MFTKKITDSDPFTEMPLSAQALYFHLNMNADDDGFLNNPKKIQRSIGASENDLKLLIAKRFILIFEKGIIVIKHWRMHNLLRKDRYTETQYLEEKDTLMLQKDGSYTEKQHELPMATTWQPSGNQVATQYSVGKDSIGKDSLGQCSGSVGDTTTTATEEDQLKLVGGSLGKGVVYLTDRQLSDLMDRLGLDAFNRYVDRLANFIIDKNAHVNNHYETILKWYEEDSKVSKTPRHKKPRCGDFNPDEAMKRAMQRTWSQSFNAEDKN
jgi:hypothetical protein